MGAGGCVLGVGRGAERQFVPNGRYIPGCYAVTSVDFQAKDGIAATTYYRTVDVPRVFLLSRYDMSSCFFTGVFSGGDQTALLGKKHQCIY